MNFSLPPSELDKIKRVSAGPTELELRISDSGALSLNDRLFMKMLDFLYSRAEERPKILQYTNYSNKISQVETVRLTRTSTDEQTAIVKLKTSRNEFEFDHDLSVFRVRIGEALELPLDRKKDADLPKIASVKLENPRVIKRHVVKVNGIVFELSEVTMNQRISYEVEVELPMEGPRQYAVRALNILIEAALSSYALPQRYFVKTVSDIEADMQHLAAVAGIASVDRIAVNPVNLKRSDIVRLDEYALTNKLDGERKFLVYFAGADHIMVMGAKGWLPRNPSSVYYIPLEQQVFPNFVLDTEFYNGVFNVFDVALYGDLRLDTVDGHQGRMLRVLDVSSQLPYVVSKRFYYESFQANLEQFMMENPRPDAWFHSSDGLIFTSKVGSYRKTSHLKYKFYSKMSIDFMLEKKQPVNGITPYELWVSAKRGSVAFTVTTDKGIARQYLNSLIDSYDKVIAECILYNDVWYILRLREDKPFPNSISTANSVYEDIVNPIQFMDLVDDKQRFAGYIKAIKNLESSFFPDDLTRHNRLFKTLYESDPRLLNSSLSRLFNTPDSMAVVSNVMGRNIDKSAPEIVFALAKAFSQPNGRGYFPHGNPIENELIASLIDKPDITFIGSKLLSEYTHIQPYINTFVFPKTDGLEYKVIDKASSKITLKPFPPELKEYKDFLAAWSGQDCVSRYSSLMPWHKPQVSAILRKWIPSRARVADLTAHVGIDAIHLRETFPDISITAYEIDPVIVDALYRNTRGLNITVFRNDSCFDLYMSSPNRYDIVYIDAPWGGSSYREQKEMELYMDQEGGPRIEARNVKNVARHIISQGIASSVILKVPANFNMKLDGFVFEVEDVFKNDKKDISYRLIRLLPKPMDPIVGGSVLIWSTPYCDSPNVIFAGKQDDILVRVSTNGLFDTALMKVMQWIYPYRGTSPQSLLKKEDVLEMAERNRYYFIGYLSKLDVLYMHFSRSQQVTVFKAPPQAPAQFSKPARPQQFQQPPRPSSFQQVVNRAPMLKLAPPPPAPHKAPERLPYGSMDYMRKYHNVEKNILIQFYCKHRSVLDLGSGKGGDLSKYQTAEVTRLVLVDPSSENLTNPEDGLFVRLQPMKIKSQSQVIEAMGQDTDHIFDKVVKQGSRVQVVSSFFSMTFLFESKDKLSGFLDTVDACLIEGGYFIGTMMDGDKSHEAFFGKNSLEYDNVTIIKKYSDDDEKTFGRKLWINIKDGIVQDQNEWLAFFPILVEEMEKRGFRLELRREFHPDSYGEAKKMNDITKAFSRLNISFVFRKMPTSIPGAIEMLPEDDSQEFFNLYGEMNTIYRTGVRGDGSCFYHAYLMAVDESYVAADTDVRKAMVASLREEFAKWVDIEKYLRILPIHTHLLLEAILRQNAGYRQAVSQLFHEKTTPGQMASFIRKNKSLVDEIIQKVKQKIANPSVWAEDKEVALFMEFKNINIYVISARTRQPITQLKTFYKPARKSSIVILSLPDYHYESMFFGTSQKFSSGTRLFAKRVLHRMDPQLIYLHQWMVRQEKNPVMKQRAIEEAEERKMVKQKKVIEIDEAPPSKKSKLIKEKS